MVSKFKSSAADKGSHRPLLSQCKQIFDVFVSCCSDLHMAKSQAFPAVPNDSCGICGDTRFPLNPNIAIHNLLIKRLVF
jgi:hypothetical protein